MSARMLIASAVFASFCSQAIAQPSSLEAGDYITREGWGQLSIKRRADGALDFSIYAMGGNAHQCVLDGVIAGTRATLEAMEKNKPCIVNFTRKGKDIHVGHNDTDDACRYFCGARAGFSDLYLKSPPGCQMDAVHARREAFKRDYDAKAYAKARTTLETVMKECQPVLYWLNEAWIRNDLAITYYRLGDRASCRSVLQPLLKYPIKSDEDVKAAFPPADATNFEPIARATRTNLRLCRDRIDPK